MERKFDLEERTFQFAGSCRVLIKDLKPTLANIEDGNS